jgi:pimeloyl-ACP methyl ester carboxylesterase
MTITSAQRPVLDGQITVEVIGAPSEHTIIFIGGWGMTVDMYRERLEKLGEHFQIYAFSLPGFGNNPHLPVKNSTVHGHFRVIHRALHALDLPGRYTLMGHSTGAGVAALIAEEHPRQVSELVMIMPIGSPDPLHRSFHRIVKHVLTTPYTGIDIKPFNRSLFSNLRLASAAKGIDLTGELASLVRHGVPLHLFVSDTDLIAPPGSLKNVPGAVVHTVPGGHSWFQTHPEQFQQSMDELLSQYRTQPAPPVPVVRWPHRLRQWVSQLLRPVDGQ